MKQASLRVEETIAGARAFVRDCQKRGETVGFVPTMGALHAGHASLAARSVAENDHTVLSIFVNPLQFGPTEDLSRYPRTFEADLELCRREGVEMIFFPRVEEMYPRPTLTEVTVARLAKGLCGASRPGHFAGVATVVTKLFNIVPADRAYFGQKDAQQCLVLRRMVADLNIATEMVICPTVRESDGLAMSSRNMYLSPEDRMAALCLSRGLFQVEEDFRHGERRAVKLAESLLAPVRAEPRAELVYAEIVSAEDLEPVEVLGGETLVALAVKFGATRLIDNVLLRP